MSKSHDESKKLLCIEKLYMLFLRRIFVPSTGDQKDSTLGTLWIVPSQLLNRGLHLHASRPDGQATERAGTALVLLLNYISTELNSCNHC